MTPTTPPAVSEAMREAVARDLEYLDRKNGGEDFPVYLTEAAFLTRYNGPIASEIARLTGERDAAQNLAYDLKYAAAGGEDVPLAAHAVTVADVNRWRDEAWRRTDALDRALSQAEARAEAAEADLTRMRAETERLRAERDELIGALEDTRAAADDLVPVCLVEGDNKAAGALQFVSGFVSDRLAALPTRSRPMLESPIVTSFAINPEGGSDIIVEGCSRFIREDEFEDYRAWVATALAEARAEGRRQGLEEAATVAETVYAWSPVWNGEKVHETIANRIRFGANATDREVGP